MRLIASAIVGLIAGFLEVLRLLGTAVARDGLVGVVMLRLMFG